MQALLHHKSGVRRDLVILNLRAAQPRRVHHARIEFSDRKAEGVLNLRERCLDKTAIGKPLLQS